MKVQAHFPKACRAEEAVSAPAEPSRVAAARTTVADAGGPSTIDAPMRTTVQESGDDYISTVPNLPHLSEGAERASRT